VESPDRARGATTGERATRPELGVGSAQVALAWLRSRPAISSTLIGARTIEQLRSKLASLEITLSADRLAALEEPSTPTLDFPAPNNAFLGPMIGFGGTNVDGVEFPLWPALRESPTRY
jgi:hypothetical protein